MSVPKRLTAVLLAIVMTVYIFADIPQAMAADERAPVFFDGSYTVCSPDFKGNTVISENLNTDAISVPSPESETDLLRGNWIRITNLSQLLAVGSGLPAAARRLQVHQMHALRR